MQPSSRTPEDMPHRCPVCGKEVCIGPSSPTCVATCPHCGNMLWLVHRPPTRLEEPATQAVLQRQPLPEVFVPAPYPRDSGRYNFAAVAWSINGLLCGAIIAFADQSLFSAALWMAVSLWFGLIVLPELFRCAGKISQRRRSLWLAVVFGWALVPGPLVGSAFGALCPLLWEAPITALEGAIIGLFVGPILTPLEGLSIVAVVVVGVWLFTGKWLHAERQIS